MRTRKFQLGDRVIHVNGSLGYFDGYGSSSSLCWVRFDGNKHAVLIGSSEIQRQSGESVSVFKQPTPTKGE